MKTMDMKIFLPLDSSHLANDFYHLNPADKFVLQLIYITIYFCVHVCILLQILDILPIISQHIIS